MSSKSKTDNTQARRILEPRRRMTLMCQLSYDRAEFDSIEFRKSRLCPACVIKVSTTKKHKEVYAICYMIDE